MLTSTIVIVLFIAAASALCRKGSPTSGTGPGNPPSAKKSHDFRFGPP